MDMNDTVQTEILTLEDLQRQKAEALEELRAQKQVMNDTARNLFAPIAPAAIKEQLSCVHLIPVWLYSTEPCLE